MLNLRNKNYLSNNSIANSGYNSNNSSNLNIGSKFHPTNYVNSSNSILNSISNSNNNNSLKINKNSNISMDIDIDNNKESSYFITNGKNNINSSYNINYSINDKTNKVKEIVFTNNKINTKLNNEKLPFSYFVKDIYQLSLEFKRMSDREYLSKIRHNNFDLKNEYNQYDNFVKLNPKK